MKYLTLLFLLTGCSTLADTPPDPNEGCNEHMCKYKKLSKKERCRREAILFCETSLGSWENEEEIKECEESYAIDCEKHE